MVKLFFVKRNLGEVLKEIELAKPDRGIHKVFFNPKISNATLMNLEEVLLKIKSLKKQFNIS